LAENENRQQKQFWPKSKMVKLRHQKQSFLSAKNETKFWLVFSHMTHACLKDIQ